jgi:hypothetical protein
MNWSRINASGSIASIVGLVITLLCLVPPLQNEVHSLLTSLNWFTVLSTSAVAIALIINLIVLAHAFGWLGSKIQAATSPANEVPDHPLSIEELVKVLTPGLMAPLKKIEKHSFQHETVYLDGVHFIECTFLDCTFAYNGTRRFMMDKCMVREGTVDGKRLAHFTTRNETIGRIMNFFEQVRTDGKSGDVSVRPAMPGELVP